MFSYLSSYFSSVSPNAISVKELATFIENERLGLDGAKDQFEQLRTTNVFNLADENARLDAGQVAAIVLELARKGGNGPLADKILERLEANEKWKANKVDLPALEQAVEGARTALQFGPKPADPDKIKDLFIEMGLEETYLDQLRVTVPLSHDQVAGLLTKWVAEQFDARAAQLLKRNVFDESLSRGVSLSGFTPESAADWIERNIECAQQHAYREPNDVLSAQVRKSQAEICKVPLFMRSIAKTDHVNPESPQIDPELLNNPRPEEPSAPPVQVNDNNAVNDNIAGGEVWNVFTSVWCGFEQTDSFSERISKLETLLISTKMRKDRGELRQIAAYVKNMLDEVKDLNELAVLQSFFLSNKIDLVIKRTPGQQSLEPLIAKQRVRLSDRAKVAEGLNEWVNQASSWVENFSRYRGAEQILAFLNEPHQSELKLYVKGITKLPAEIGALSHLKELRLGEGKLEGLPDSIGLLSNLQVLHLYRTELESLPDSIGDLMNLRELSLKLCRPESLPDSIGRLTNLEVLDLSYNKLRTLPHWIGGLSNLQRLNLHSNKLYRLPDSIGRLRNLRHLDLRWNPQLRSLPDSINQLNLSEESREQIAEIRARQIEQTKKRNNLKSSGRKLSILEGWWS